MALPEIKARITADTADFESGMVSAEKRLSQFNSRVATASNQVGGMGKTVQVNTGHLSNMSAQFQDIAVMMASGQSPFQLAMQQGTQLASVLQGVRNPLQYLGAAFMSLVNPVSIATIGMVALGAAAGQAILSLIPQTESATDALKRHKEAIDAATFGYDDAGKAVQSYIDELNRLPKEAALAQVTQQFQDMISQTEQFREKAAALGPTLAFSANAADQELGNLLVAFTQGKISADELATELNRIANTKQGINDLFGVFTNLVKEMRDGALAAVSMQDALIGVSFAAVEMQNAFSKDVLGPALEKAISSQEESISKLKSLTPDLRTQSQIITDTFNEAMNNPVLTEAMRAEIVAAKDAALAMQQKADAAKAAETAVRASSTAQAEAARMQASFDTLKAQLEGPMAQEQLQYEQRLAQLDAFYAAKGEKDAEYYRLAGLAKEQHEAALEKIDQAARAAEMQRQQMMVNNVTSILGSIGQIMATQGDKQIATQKAISTAIAAINTAQGISKAFADYGWPGGLLPAAAVAAQGAAQIAAINSASRTSAGVSGPSSSGAGTSTQMNRTLTVQGITPGQIFSGDAMRDFMDQMLQMQRDGYQVVLA